MSFQFDLANRAEWEDRTVVLYDGSCPFCSRYVAYQRLQQTLGSVLLIDARGRPDLVSAFDRAGLPLDEGMALIMNGSVYHGADCINRLALMSSRSGAFNRLNAFVFRTPVVSKLMYPILRAGRSLSLRFLGVGSLEGGRRGKQDD